MELNTNYWGDNGGSYLVPSDFKWAGFAYGTPGQSLADLWRAGKITLNEQVDPSAFYCYSYASKIASYHYVSLYNRSYSEHTIGIDYHDSPFANYALGYRGYAYTSFINGRQSKTSAIGYDISDASGATQRILTRYALARMRFVCYVVYVPSYNHDIYDPSVLVLPAPTEVQLKDFLDNSRLMSNYENENLIILGLKWYAYIKNDNSTLVGTRYDQVVPFSVNNFDMDNSTEQTGVHENKWYLPAGAGVLEQGGYMGSNSIGIGEVGHFCIPNTSDKWAIKICKTSGTSRVFAQPCLKPSVLLDAFHEFAYVGIVYTNNVTSAANKSFADEDVFIPIIAFGKTSGKYKQGNPNWSDDEAEAAVLQANPPAINDTDTEDDPNPDYTGQDDPAQVDPNDYSLDTPLTPPTLTTINIFNRSFAMTAVQIRALADWLWNADDDKMTEIIEGLALAGENPMNALIDCRLYPFAITDMIGHAGSELIVIGRTASDVYGIKLENEANCIIDLGECSFYEENKNFLDYSPYTQARLYIPYCGWHSIDPAEFMGKKITGKLIVDIVTGACNCLIYADGVILINATGTIGVEIPMTGTDSAAFASQTINASMQCISNIVQAGADVIGGMGSISKGTALTSRATNIGSLSRDRASDFRLGSSMQTEGAQQFSTGLGAGADAVYAGWKAHTVPVQYEMAGAATPACANWLPQYAYFVIDRPVPLIPKNYGHTIGFACCESGLLSGYSGFTVCSNVDTSGFAQATEAERAELKALLEAGVYL